MPGDLIVAAGVDGFDVFDVKCDVPNRDQQHDSMMLVWCYRAHSSSDLHPLPARASNRRPREPESDLNDALPKDVQYDADHPDWNAGLDDNEQLAAREEERQLAVNNEDDQRVLQSTEDEQRVLQSTEDEQRVPQSTEDEQRVLQSSKSSNDDALQAVGFALATSASLMAKFNVRSGTKNCLDGINMKRMEGVCSEEDVRALEDAAQLFFCKRLASFYSDLPYLPGLHPMVPVPT